MTCRDSEGLIIPYASGASVSSEAAAHIAGCESCRRLARAMAQSPQIVPPLPDQLKTIEARILAELETGKATALCQGAGVRLGVHCRGNSGGWWGRRAWDRRLAGTQPASKDCGLHCSGRNGGSRGLFGGPADRAWQQAPGVSLAVGSCCVGRNDWYPYHLVSPARGNHVRCDRPGLPQDRDRVRHSGGHSVLAGAAAGGNPASYVHWANGGRTGRPGWAHGSGDILPEFECVPHPRLAPGSCPGERRGRAGDRDHRGVFRPETLT